MQQKERRKNTNSFAALFLSGQVSIILSENLLPTVITKSNAIKGV